VLEKFAIHIGKTKQDAGFGGEGLAHLDESADDIHAHGGGAVAFEDIGGLEGTVFGEGVGQFAATPRPGFDIAFCDVKAGAARLPVPLIAICDEFNSANSSRVS